MHNNMQDSFELYSKNPWFWFYIELSIAASIIKDPRLSVNNTAVNLTSYSYDIYALFESLLIKYNLIYKHNFRGPINGKNGKS